MNTKYFIATFMVLKFFIPTTIDAISINPESFKVVITKITNKSSFTISMTNNGNQILTIAPGATSSTKIDVPLMRSTNNLVNQNQIIFFNANASTPQDSDMYALAYFTALITPSNYVDRYNTAFGLKFKQKNKETPIVQWNHGNFAVMPQAKINYDVELNLQAGPLGLLDGSTLIATVNRS